MTGRKPLTERIRERAWAIHRRDCKDDPCDGPYGDEWEQAAREVMRSEEAKP